MNCLLYIAEAVESKIFCSACILFEPVLWSFDSTLTVDDHYHSNSMTLSYSLDGFANTSCRRMTLLCASSDNCLLDVIERFLYRPPKQ